MEGKMSGKLYSATNTDFNLAYQEFRRLRGHSRHKRFRLLTQGLRPTREGVPASCFADGQTNPPLRQNASGPLWCQRCADGALDFRKVEPQMPAVIVLAEHDFAIGARDGVAELVAIAALLKNGSGDPEIGETA